MLFFGYICPSIPEPFIYQSQPVYKIHANGSPRTNICTGHWQWAVYLSDEQSRVRFAHSHANFDKRACSPNPMFTVQLTVVEITSSTMTLAECPAWSTQFVSSYFVYWERLLSYSNAGKSTPLISFSSLKHWSAR